MHKIFNYESKAMQAMMGLASMIAMNILYLICCIPVVTAGAAQAGLYSGIRHLQDKEADTSCLPVFKTIYTTLGGWLKAQGKLAALTFAVVAAGFLLLGIPQGIWWALPVAAVDSIPVLGTGIVLIPWAFVCFLKGQTVRAVGLGVLWIATVLLRRVLEPKLVGQHLELDPLVTLIFLYLGCRLWGFWGMILAPLLAGAAKQVTQMGNGEN